ncbi:MAG: asparagine synthase-related protein, partial [Dissulfurispiraceae bacterium]
KLVRSMAPVRITGTHGSEILRNNRCLKGRSPLKELFSSDFKEEIRSALKTVASFNDDNSLSFALFKEAPWLEYNRLVIEQSQLTIRSPFMDNELAGLMYRAPSGSRSTAELSLRLIDDGNPELHRIMTDRGVYGKSNNLFLLFLRLYYEGYFKAEYYYNYGMPQWLAKLDFIMKTFHPERLFLGRHKFYHFRVWFRDELSNYVREILLDTQTIGRPYLNKHFVEKIVRGHTQGYRNFTTEITKMLTLELIQRLLIEQ